MIAGLALGALSTALLLDAVRRFSSTSAISLAPQLSPPVVAFFVLLPFVLQVPVVALLSRVDPRRALFACAAALVLTARVAAVVGETAGVIALAGLACLSGSALLALLICVRPTGQPFLLPQAIALGLIVDLARRTALGTLDLADLPGDLTYALAAIESVIFVAAAALALRGPHCWMPPAVSGPLAVVAVPFALVVAELAGTNGWQTAAAAGLGLADGDGLRVTMTGTVAVALGLALGAYAPGRSLRLLGSGCLLAGALISAARIPTLSLAGGTLLAAGLLMCLRVIGSGRGRGSPSPTRVAAALAAGWVGFMAVTLSYWALYAFMPALWLAIALLIVATLTSGGRADAAAWPLRGAAIAAIILPIALISVAPRAVGAVPVPGTLRLMTYNIHFGFDHRQIPSLDELARTIEAASPDIVVLQEVMRGASLAAQHDSLGWLAARLGMSYVFAPTIGDVFGNAVLTRLPVDEVRRIAFVRPGPLRHSPRGALLVRVAGITVISTHLDEYVDAASDAVREDQVRVLLREWGAAAAPVVIAGDLNALPDSAAIALLLAAGFRDLAADVGSTVPGSTFPAIAPQKRIDYVFARGLGSLSSRVLPSRASDHLAVVVDLTPAPR